MKEHSIRFIIKIYICKMLVNSDIDIKELRLTDTTVQTHFPFNLVVWNDEVNTFEWVIESLMDVCKHSEEQAEQCAMIIHFQGKYAVKNGDYDSLKLMKEAITERKIEATIEEAVNHK